MWICVLLIVSVVCVWGCMWLYPFNCVCCMWLCVVFVCVMCWCTVAWLCGRYVRLIVPVYDCVWLTVDGVFVCLSCWCVVVWLRSVVMWLCPFNCVCILLFVAVCGCVCCVCVCNLLVWCSVVINAVDVSFKVCL